MKGSKTFYVCTSCDYRTPKWMGKCPQCGAWSSFVEDVVEPSDSMESKTNKIRTNSLGNGGCAVPVSDIEQDEFIRTTTGIAEFDRVLGSGLVKGSVVLLTGEPGIGKSTLLLQICRILSLDRKVLYISGEESAGQIKLRAERLNVSSRSLFVMSEANVEKILSECDKLLPDVIIVDSIQTMYTPLSSSSPGTVSQVKESAMTFIAKAKNDEVSVILVGHVNKEGTIAGPKVLEHMVDAVLTFEGDRQQSYRIIRAVKNRYGSTDEIGVFEMTDSGLIEVPNPSEVLLAGRPKKVSGNCAVCTMEGTRPLIAEIQALVCPTSFPSPRRTVNGVDYTRVCMITAVLEKRLGLHFSSNDLYINVIGGFDIEEPAADMAIALSMISSITDKLIPDDLVAIGEIGLAGECRAVSSLEQRVKEAERLGFVRIIVPYRNLQKREIKTSSIKLIPVKSVYEILLLLENNQHKEN